MKMPKKAKLNNFLGNLTVTVKSLPKTALFRMCFPLFLMILIIILVFAQTIAWQTNVVHTGGVMFSVETWDFSAEVALVGQQMPSSPGDSGVIEIRMTNDSSELAVASVKVSKEQLNPKMRSRMFFYVDTYAVRNGETVNGLYINSRNSYTYTIFPHHQVMLGTGVSYQPSIKWEWTYDNLGYYVYGKKDASGNVQVEEYLCPIKYDFDFMRTTFDENGRLMTIDGVLTAEDFLISFSKTDGYKGQIEKGSMTADGYYPIEINNDTGFGIFAYLCTLDEINEGSRLDTQLGNDSASIGQATVQFTGQNCGSDGTLVFDENSLKSALSTPGLNVLTLNQDIELSEPISINQSCQSVIDLAGHKIISTANTVIKAQEGALLMLNNGEIKGNKGTGVSLSSAYVTLNDVTITNVEEGITIYDNKSSGAFDSVIHLNGCDIQAEEDGLLIYGNIASAQKTNVIIEKSNIIGQNYAGVICNGTHYGTDISITNSTVKGKYTSVYFPQRDSTLTLNNCILEGYTGLAVKGGTVNVIDCAVTGTGKNTPLPQDSAQLSMSGWWDTGDGIYLEVNYSQYPTKITISGENTKVIGSQEGTFAVRKYPVDVSKASIEILGGSFSSDVTDYVKNGYSVSLSSGWYTVAKE